MLSDLDKRVEALEERLKVLEAERGILLTLYRYAHTIDYGLKKDWVDCFTDDALYQVQLFGETLSNIMVPQPPEGIKGKEILSQYIHNHTNAPDLWHKHWLVEPIIKLEGDDKATVDSYFARIDEDEKGAYIMSVGRYSDKMVKCPDNKWRFKERHCNIESRMPVRG